MTAPRTPPQNCSTCTFAVQRTAQLLECHHSAPATIFVTAKHEVAGVWPPVLPSDWCGEFSSKPAPATTSD